MWAAGEHDRIGVVRRAVVGQADPAGPAHRVPRRHNRSWRPMVAWIFASPSPYQVVATDVRRDVRLMGRQLGVRRPSRPCGRAGSAREALHFPRRQTTGGSGRLAGSAREALHFPRRQTRRVGRFYACGWAGSAGSRPADGPGRQVLGLRMGRVGMGRVLAASPDSPGRRARGRMGSRGCSPSSWTGAQLRRCASRRRYARRVGHCCSSPQWTGGRRLDRG
jgi:hypothetical protein